MCGKRSTVGKEEQFKFHFMRETTIFLRGRYITDTGQATGVTYTFPSS